MLAVYKTANSRNPIEQAISEKKDAQYMYCIAMHAYASYYVGNQLVWASIPTQHHRHNIRNAVFLCNAMSCGSAALKAVTILKQDAAR